MDNEHTLEYKGYTINIARQTKTQVWHVDARGEGHVISVKGKNRDELVDDVQFKIDLAEERKNPEVQLSKKGLLNWLEH
jgi:hypothetical protein